MSPRGRRGHSLVEILVGVTVAALILSLALHAWAPMARATLALRQRALAVAALQLCCDYLRQDLGGAERLSRIGDDALWIEREPAVAELAGSWTGSSDPGIEYSFAGGRLVRRDVAADATVVVATRLTGFSVTELDEDSFALELRAGTGLGERAVRLLWEE